MRSRSQAASTPSSSLTCPKCGLTLSASLVKQSGKCLRCDTPVAAPAGTPALSPDAAAQAAKFGFLPATPGQAQVTHFERPARAAAPADDFGPGVAEEDAMRMFNGAEEEGAQRAGDDIPPDGLDPFGDDLGAHTPIPAPPAEKRAAPRTETRVSAEWSERLSAYPPTGERQLPVGGALPIADLPIVETVSVTWGEELCSPVQYNTFKVGPFTATGPVLPGETRLQAMTRLYADLQAFADQERARKAKSYLDALGKLKPGRG